MLLASAVTAGMVVAWWLAGVAAPVLYILHAPGWS
jgi:hypothetical protein